MTPRGRVGTLVWTTMVILMALPAMASAQEASIEGTTWYVHDFTDPSGESAFLNFEPPAGESDQTATDLEAAGVDNFVIEIAADAPTEGTMTAAADVGEAVVYVKSWNSGPAPRTRVRAFVHADDVEIANSGSGVIQDVINGAIVEFRIPLTVVETTIPAGATVTMTVWIDDANTGRYNPLAYPRGVSEEHPWSVTLPMLADGGADVVEETLPAGDEAEVALDFANVTNATYRYAWDAGLNGSVEIAYAVALTAGNVTLRVVDGANATRLDVMADGPAEETVVAKEVAAGNWTVEVVAVGALGNATLSIRPYDEPAAPIEEPSETGNETDGNGTTSLEEDGGLVPGFETPLVALGLLVAAFGVARRRRD